MSSTLTQDKITCYLEEYRQCAEGYRHTYRTIWQTGTVFAGFSVAVFGFGLALSQTALATTLLRALILFTPLVSILIWWLWIFVPMNRYGDLRQLRCKKIEEELNAIVSGLDIRHFRDFVDMPERHGILRVRVGVGLFVLVIFVLAVLFFFSFSL